MRGVLRLLAILIVALAPNLSAAGSSTAIAAAVADSFTYPMDLSARTGMKGYGITNTDLSGKSGCYGVAMSSLYHTGEDWFAPTTTPIHAIANGVVYYVSPTSVCVQSAVLAGGGVAVSIMVDGHRRLPPS